jgi:NMD protein affecting ribosome stability and mRNA decay
MKSHLARLERIAEELNGLLAIAFGLAVLYVTVLVAKCIPPRQQKLHEGTVCPQCRAVYHHGRWQWAVLFEGVGEELCPACRRIKEEFPAGVVTLRGDFAREHKEEMIHLARHQEEAEKKEHPLNRVMSIEEEPHGVVINTADIHLPRRIGEAVKRAFHGEIEDRFEKDGYFVRVTWTREA